MELKFTRYFLEQVKGNHPEATTENIIEALSNEVKREEQAKGRTAIWGMIKNEGKLMRVIIESTGEIHNAFYDRNMTKKFSEEK